MVSSVEAMPQYLMLKGHVQVLFGTCFALSNQSTKDVLRKYVESNLLSG